MTVRRKTLVVISVTLVGLVSILYAASRKILLQGFARVEDQRIRVNVRRAQDALSNELTALDRTASDYAAWDQTYAYMERRNESFVKTEFTDETFVRIGLNAVILVDSAKTVVFAKGFDLHKKEEVPLAAGLRPLLAKDSPLLSHSDPNSRLVGLLVLSESPILLASRPILNSEGAGPIRGTLLMARFLDEAEVERLAKLTHLSLEVFRYDDPQSPPDIHAATSSISPDEPIFVRPIAADTIAGYTIVNDLRGRPGLVLRVRTSRDIYRQGLASMRYLILSVLGAGVVFSALTFLLIEKLVLSRLARLSAGVNRIGTSGEVSARLRISGADELSNLAEAINSMLATVERSENDLRKAREAAEAADRAKSEFLANMSHEIRTPMTAVLGFAENLLDPDLSESERLNAINIIRRNGEHLLTIIDDILDLSKIEAGKIEVIPGSCSVFQVVSDVESMMRVRAEGKGLAFKVEYLGPIPETIRTDPVRLRQILVNLIGNAIKFTETGGVRLVVRYVEERPEGSSDVTPMMQFDVLDTGIGMTAEQITHLFQPFHQAETSISRRFGGTGLGLAISRRFAEALGGNITVESRPGEGSTFRVRIAAGPLEGVRFVECGIGGPPPQAAAPTKAPAAYPRLNARVLLAEDGPDNRRLISLFLTKAGAEVTTVENGQAAVEKALQALQAGNPFDVILMDIQMPVLDGYAAASLLRRKGYTRPIIALTAHAMTSERDKCLKAGYDDYATKPIDRARLLDLVAQHLLSAEVVPATGS